MLIYPLWGAKWDRGVGGGAKGNGMWPETAPSLPLGISGGVQSYHIYCTMLAGISTILSADLVRLFGSLSSHLPFHLYKGLRSLDLVLLYLTFPLPYSSVSPFVALSDAATEVLSVSVTSHAQPFL